VGQDVDNTGMGVVYVGIYVVCVHMCADLHAAAGRGGKHQRPHTANRSRTGCTVPTNCTHMHEACTLKAHSVSLNVSGHRKAALDYLRELIQRRVSLEMHHEETRRHQEAHKQMDHHLAAVSGQSLWVGTRS